MKEIGHSLQQKNVRFKYRKVIHYTLIGSIISLQLLLFAMLYNKYFNAPKLEKLQEDLHLSEQIGNFNNLTKDSYLNAQLNLQNYILTADTMYLTQYNEALNSLNLNLNKLADAANKSDLLSLFLKHSNTDLTSIKKLVIKIDSVSKIKIPDPLKWNDYLLKNKKFEYNTIIDSLSYEKSISVDSVRKKGLLTRVGNAIVNKVEVQKETENIVLTLGNDAKAKENIEKQFEQLFETVNKYYQKEFKNYKEQYTKYITKTKTEESDFLKSNKELLLYSNILLEKYNKALIDFTKETRKNFEKQYKSNEHLNNIVSISLMFFVVLISILLAFLTKMEFAYKKKLEIANEEIKNNLNFKNRIVGMISHEIRAPLNIISIYSKGIRNQVEDEDVKDSLKSIEFTTNSLHLLANQILEFSKNESIDMHLNSKAFSLQQELKGLFNALENMVSNNGNQLIILNNIDENLPLVFSDPVKIHQLFYNIIGNANKFTTNGCITIDVNFEYLNKDKLNILVKIIDNGVGIDEEDLKYIFEEYHQGTISKGIKNFGVGLGLNLCREIIELYEGKINVTSKKDIETVVYFNLLLPFLK